MSDESPNPLKLAESWLADHGDALLAYAVRRLPGLAVAEDVVQETLLAGLKAAGGFRGEADVRTWLTGILRRKIADFYRRQARETPAGAGEPGESSFDEQGYWRERPGGWGADPAATAESAEFQAAVARCVEKLPPTLRPAFQLRVLDELKTEEICSMLEISPTNLSVRLARARTLLRGCLERTWFGDAADGSASR